MADYMNRDPLLFDDADDDVLQRVRATLAPLPPANPQAVARVLAAVHGRAPSRWGRYAAGWTSLMTTLRLSPLSLYGGATILVATLASIIVVRSSVPRAGGTLPSVSGVPPVAVQPSLPAGIPEGADMRAAGAVDDPEAALPVQFVLDAATAQSVSLVGDFNDWSTSAAPMQRLPGSGVWTITLPVKPGRHVYAFVVDGTRWMADPRAARAPDADFGKPGSVLLVNPR